MCIAASPRNIFKYAFAGAALPLLLAIQPASSLINFIMREYFIDKT